jgi:hypothetical protein
MFKKAAAALVVAAGLFLAPAKAVPVDVELQLLVDTSGSVSAEEFALQLNGYAEAFRSAEVKNAIASGTLGSVAVQLVFWAADQEVAIDWFLIDSASAADSFADMVAALSDPFGGGTRIDRAIEFGFPLFFNNAFEGARQVVDISGDGNSSPSSTREARDAALAAGVDTINGLVIEDSDLIEFYEDNVIGGMGAFVMFAATFQDFADAIRTKLVTEIMGPGGGEIPLPGAALFLLTGIAGFIGLRRRKLAA